MSGLSPFTILLTLCIAAVLLVLRSTLRWRARSRGLPLPPGPKPLPVIGNMLDLPKYKPWSRLREMSKQYGDIVHLNVLGQSMVVLGSASIVTEYLEKRSRNTADRASNAVVDLSGQLYNFAVIPYGQWWRRHRRVFWQEFHPNAVTKYNPVQLTHTHRFLARLLQSPSRVTEHIRFSLSALLLEVAYGVDLTDEHDENLVAIDNLATALEQDSPGHFAVDILPVLRHLPGWFPGAGFQKTFAECKAAVDHLLTVPFNAVKEAMVYGEARECLAATLLAKANEDEKILRDVCVVSIQGGVDTTTTALNAFFVAMGLFPEVQRKAQAELDRVVGPHRLPEYSDSADLVYINALIKELLRWHLVIPLGIQHCTFEDDELHGYFIPAGTILIPNVWDIMHDPDAYESPDEFRPERFIRDGKLDPSVRDPNAFIFGFGKRFCPGRYFALASLFVHVASVLHVFDIGLPVDDAGKPIQIKHEQGPGLVSQPEDCRCTIKPRSASAEELIALAQHNISHSG